MLGLLSHPPSTRYPLPGNALERAALAYLHVNCGNCHNNRAVKPALEVHLLLSVGELATVQETAVYRTALGAMTRVANPLEDTAATRIVAPGDPDASLLYLRMLRRPPSKGQMPNFGTEQVDPEGSTLIADWIRSLPP